MQIVLVDAADFQRLDAQVLADAVILMDDVIAGLDIPEMRNPFAGILRPPDRAALMASEDILLSHDDETGRNELKAREQRTQANVQGIVAQGIFEPADEGWQAPVCEELPQAVGFLLVTDQKQHALFWESQRLASFSRRSIWRWNGVIVVTVMPSVSCGSAPGICCSIREE